MSLKLRKYNSGALRPHWYGRYVKDTKRLEVSLCSWRGIPPATGLAKDRGDSEFEYSRMQGEAILKNLKNQSHDEKEVSKRRRLEVKAAQQLLKVKYGQTQTAGIELKTLWEKMARKLYTGRDFTRNDEYTRSKVERFSGFMADRFPKTRYLETVAIEELDAFFNYLEKDLHFTSRTWNDNLVTLRGVFRKYASYTKSYEWLRDLKRKPAKFISRELFNPEETLEIIQKVSELDS